jgi:peptidoglycan lytic transglycosylase A
MAKLPSRTVLGAAFGFCVIASAPMPAQALHFRHAAVEALSFDQLDGWTQDDQSAAFSTFMKSCDAILQGTRAMRKARPIYGGLYNACEKATTLAAGGKVDTA